MDERLTEAVTKVMLLGVIERLKAQILATKARKTDHFGNGPLDSRGVKERETEVMLLKKKLFNYETQLKLLNGK